MKLVFIISLLLTVAVAQEPSLSCLYFLSGATYGCDLTINNPNGFNNFTEIEGIQLDGFTNFDVLYLYRITGISTNVPSIICDTFPNLIVMDLYNLGLTEIDDSAFGGCSRITELQLYSNRISSISTNAFANLLDIWSINLEFNLLTTLPENVFANQQNLTNLHISRNPFDSIPGALFRPLENLQILLLGSTNLTEIHNEWFITNTRLYELHLDGNRIAVSADSFVGLESLRALDLGNNGINEIPVGAFARLPNLESLYLTGNNFTELNPDSFPDLEHLIYLDISANPIDVIHDGAFRELQSLDTLIISSCGIRQLHSNSFVDLGNLTNIYLNFNEIEELPEGVFVPSPNLNYIGLWNNRLKTLRRNSFGTLTSLQSLDLDNNVLNALDRSIIDDAVNLNTLFFYSNLCASNFFPEFEISRSQYLQILERCFTNVRYIVDTITEGGDTFSFFEGTPPGIAFRVNTDNEVQIALTPFNFEWSPIIEVFIGTTNNTRSSIRINQETDVATVPTPNIIIRNQWNDFRVTWANQVILVYSGNNVFPFLAFTMRDFFPVNFYGLRAVETRASWSVQPFDW